MIRSSPPCKASSTPRGYLAAQAEVDALEAVDDSADEEIDAALDRYNPAFDALLNAPVANLTDVERKLAASARYYRGSLVRHALLDELLLEVRAATGRAA